MDGARVDEIARKAGVNKRMIYHYFGDKDGLYLAVLESAYAAIRHAEIGLKLNDLDPEEGMRALVRFTWDYFFEQPEFLSLLATENLHRAAYLKKSKAIRELHSPLVGMISELLAAGRRNRRCFARASIRSSSILASPRSAFFICRTSTRYRPSSTGTWARRPRSTERGQHIADVVLGYLRP